MATGWESAGQVPLPPQNVQVTSPFLQGVLDLRWDDPVLLARNTAFTIVGANVYRSEASDRGPYRRINEYPVGGSFYRDSTDTAWISNEIVRWDTDWLFRGDAPNDRKWSFKTRHPIVKRYGTAPFHEATSANAPVDVTVRVNGIEIPVDDVFGKTGEVTLVNVATYDIAREKFDAPGLPKGPDDTVEVSYRTAKNHVRSGLDIHVWYRVVSVALDSTTPSGYRETPIGRCEPKTVGAVETLDYIWREAVRRNQWILQQGGERVKAFVRKTAGVPCGCGMDPMTSEYGKQPSNRCHNCFGTGLRSGFEGPYDIIVAPDDSERRISQSQFGRRKEHTYEVFMGPSPMMTQRDFLVKQTNERYSVGPVRRPTNRGNILQQHFNIAYLDEGDIRYKVPIDGTADLAWPQARDTDAPYSPRPVDGEMSGAEPWPVGPFVTTPMTTEKADTPNGREQRGRSRVWENQSG